MTVDDFDGRCDTLIQVSHHILGATIIYERDIEVITGFTKTPHYAYPEITTQVGYLVTTLVDRTDATTELTGIYIYQNSTILRELLDFLANLDVSNIDDLMAAQTTLRELYWSITPKS